MNLRQSYEQLIADKLRQLRAPDADSSWQQMKRLLDDDEDKGAGAKRPPGNNGWWRIGIIAVVLSASFWLYADRHLAPGNSLSKNSSSASPQAGNKTGGADNTNNSDKTQTTTIEDKTTLTDLNTNTSTAADKNKSNTKTEESIALNDIKSKTNPVINKAAANNNNSDIDAATALPATANAVVPAGSTQKNNTAQTTATNSKTEIKNGSRLPGNHQEIETADATANTIAKNNSNNTGTQNNIAANVLSFKQKNGTTNKPSGLKNNTATNFLNNTDEAFVSNQPAHSKHHVSPKAGNKKNDEADNVFTPANNQAGSAGNNSYSQGNQPVAAKEKTWYERWTELAMPAPAPSFTIAVTAGDSIASSRDVSNLLNTETKKAIAKAQREKAIELLDKKDKKSLHLNLGNLFKPFSMRPLDVEPWWAAGLALNGGITVHAQNRYNYNVNGKSSMLTDYIPSPYLQYHLNNYVYLQTELNFITPQYTPQLLVYRQNNAVTATGAGTGGISQQKSIYIQKLYYFNWPVSLHYSPVSNLYFSAGIQFSSFQSGLAAIEAKQYATALSPDHSTAASTTVLKFKDDSIAAKIAPNEWRWQVGAEYYWNRFSMGLRYNQSFKNSINTPVSASLPPTVNRNESLLFFVRYNLFESRNKNSDSKNQ